MIPATRADFDAAIRAFWTGRTLQTQKQIETGKIDAGTRGSVTGGKHLGPLQEVIAEQFAPLLELGAKVYHRGMLPLPGHYRRTKNWDIVVKWHDSLVAAIECKSMSGSFGKNFNNRAEEAIGNAVDLRHAYEAGLVGPMRPWLGFVFVLEHTWGSTVDSHSKVKPLYTPNPAFDDASYTARYRILLRQLVHEQLYDTACLISSRQPDGIYDEPAPDLSTQNLTSEIARRVAQVREIN